MTPPSCHTPAAGVSGSGSFIGSSGGSFISSSGPEGLPGAKEGIKGRRPSSFIQVSSAPQRAGLDFNENAAKNAEENGGASAADSAMANTLMLPAFEAQKVCISPTLVLFNFPPLHLSTSPPLHLSTSPPLHLSTSPPLHLHPRHRHHPPHVLALIPGAQEERGARVGEGP